LHKTTEISLIQMTGFIILGKNPRKCGDMHIIHCFWKMGFPKSKFENQKTLIHHEWTKMKVEKTIVATRIKEFQLTDV